MTRSQASKPTLFVKRVEEGTISGPALVEILQAVLDHGAPFRFRATGFSMTPFVRDGDVVTVAPLSAPATGRAVGRALGRGDVVAFVRPDTGKLVIHRIVGQRGDAFLIRGDNVEQMDGPVPAASILGRVTRVERKGKPVYLGLGPERHLIALFTRWGLVHHLLPWLRLVRQPIVRLLQGTRPEETAS